MFSTHLRTPHLWDSKRCGKVSPTKRNHNTWPTYIEVTNITTTSLKKKVRSPKFNHQLPCEKNIITMVTLWSSWWCASNEVRRWSHRCGAHVDIDQVFCGFFYPTGPAPAAVGFFPRFQGCQRRSARKKIRGVILQPRRMIPNIKLFGSWNLRWLQRNLRSCGWSQRHDFLQPLAHLVSRQLPRPKVLSRLKQWR